MTAYLGPKISTQGMTLYLDAASQKSYPGSGTTWKDLVQPAQFTLTGTTFSQGYLTFNGSTDYLGLGTGYNYSTSFSSEIWFYCLSTPGVNGFNLVRSRTYGFGIGLNASPLTLTANVYTTSVHPSGNTALSTTDIALNQWFQVTMTFGSGTISLYLNSMLIGSSPTVTSTIYYGGATYMSLMRDGDYNGGYANCRLGLYKHYNRTLSQDEVRQNFDSVRTRYGI